MALTPADFGWAFAQPQDNLGSYTILYQSMAGAASLPQISGSFVVWSEGYGKTSDVIVLDLRSNEETRVTDDGCGNFAPDVSGSTVVYVRTCSDNPGIYGHDLESGQTFLISEEAVNLGGPHISGSYVTWPEHMHCVAPPPADCHGPVGYPVAKDLTTGEVWRVGDEHETPTVAIVDHYALWRDRLGQQFVADLQLKTLTLLATTMFWDGGISGSAILVRLGGTDDDVLSLYDLATGMAQPLVDLPRREGGADRSAFAYSRSAGMLVYMLGPGSESDIAAYDLREQSEIKLTDTADVYERWPAIFGDTVVWQDVSRYGSPIVSTITAMRLLPDGDRSISRPGTEHASNCH